MRLAAQLVERVAEHGGAGRLVVPHRQRQQDPRGPDAAGQEGHEPSAHLVGPVDVLQHDEDRFLRSETEDEMHQALEEPTMVRRMAGRFSRRGRQLGEKTRQISARRRREAFENLDVGGHVRAAKRVDPGTEREHLLRLVRATDEESDAARLSLGSQGHEHTALADSRLAHDRDHAAVPSQGLIQRVSQAGQLPVSPDQRHVANDQLRTPVTLGASRVACRSGVPVVDRSRLGGPPLENVLVELLRFRLRLGAQLALQRGDARLVLLECGAPAPLAGIEPHQRAMHALL